MKQNLYKSLYLSLAVGFGILTGCEKEYESIEILDERNIQSYITENKLTLQKKPDGTYFSFIKYGNGEEILYSEKIPLIYTIKTLDGSYSNQDTFINHYGGANQYLGYFTPEPLSVAIKENIKREGGEVRMIVPSNLAFGRNGSGPIPGNASLDYWVKVLDKRTLPAYEEKSILKYIQVNNLGSFTKSADGIYYKVITPGSGSAITADSLLTTQYVGKLFNGKIFDQTSGSVVDFTLSETIQAWVKIVPLIKGGGTIRILTPSSSAYGIDGVANPFGGYSIPPFSCLDFELTVVDVKQPTL